MATWLIQSMSADSSNKKTNGWWRGKSMRWVYEINPVVALMVSIFSALTHSTWPQTHLGWQRLTMLPPAQRNPHSSKLSSLQSHADSNGLEMPPFWDMQFKEKMSLRRGKKCLMAERLETKRGRMRGERARVCCESLVRWEHCCFRTNWVSAWAMGGLASKLLSSARADGRLWEVKSVKTEPYGNPWI